MDTRNTVDGLKTLLGVPSTAAPAQPVKSKPASGALAGDHATVSSAASEVFESAADQGVRAEKVAAVQAALAAGSYNVPASAVAAKVVDAMLTMGRQAGE